jgi:cobalt/nickel transport system permease protein
MIFIESLSLWAVHLPDGLLTAPWWIGGLVASAAMTIVGAWRIRDEEIPQVALLTAAFFIATSIHVPVPAGPKTHLLLNGLLGVILGRRALLAIPLGLVLQVALLQHGGYAALGVNACVMALPALLCWFLFAGLRRLPWIRHPWSRAVLVWASGALFLLLMVYSVSILLSNSTITQLGDLDTTWANRITFQPPTLLGIAAAAVLFAVVERRLENSPEFPVGLLLGQIGVLTTVFLNGLALLLGGEGNYYLMVLLTIIVHLPLAMIEGIILGFTMGFLARVKPELIGWTAESEVGGQRSEVRDRESGVGGPKSEVGEEVVRL